MNLLLLDPEALGPDGSTTLEGPRATHVRQVLGAVPGSTLRAGVLDQSIGEARVEAVDADRVLLRYRARQPCPAPATRVLLLGMPRPKALSRCVQHAAALGFTRILLLGCQRVEKGQLRSGRIDRARLRADLILGLEQGEHIHLPQIDVFVRFKPFVEDNLDELVPQEVRFVAHPGAPPLRDLAPAPSGVRYTLAIGPDGGFVPYEVELLVARGFVPFASEVGTLRVESAVSYFTGQLDAALAGAAR